MCGPGTGGSGGASTGSTPPRRRARAPCPCDASRRAGLRARSAPSSDGRTEDGNAHCMRSACITTEEDGTAHCLHALTENHDRESHRSPTGGRSKRRAGAQENENSARAQQSSVAIHARSKAMWLSTHAAKLRSYPHAQQSSVAIHARSKAPLLSTRAAKLRSYPRARGRAGNENRAIEHTSHLCYGALLPPQRGTPHSGPTKRWSPSLPSSSG